MLLNRQLLFLIVMLVVSVGYLVSALSLGAPTSDSGLTPSFFPICVGAAAIGFSSLLILQQLRGAPDDDAAAAPAGHTHLWVTLAIFVYILAFKPLGYFLSSTLFVLALMVLFSSAAKLWQKALISLAVVGLGYVMFEQLFGVRLPTLWG